MSETPHTPRADEPRTLAGEIHVLYTNHRGETRERRLLPRGLWFGATEWHPDPQWLLSAEDRETGERRDFALRDMLRSPKGEPRTLAQRLRDAGHEVTEPTVDGRPPVEAYTPPAGSEPRTLEREQYDVRTPVSQSMVRTGDLPAALAPQGEGARERIAFELFVQQRQCHPNEARWEWDRATVSEIGSFYIRADRILRLLSSLSLPLEEGERPEVSNG